MPPVFRFKCPGCKAAGVVNEGRLSLPRHTHIGGGRVNDKSWYYFECWNGGRFMLTPPVQQQQEEEKLFEDVTAETWSGRKFHYTQPGVIAEAEPQPEPDNQIDPLIATFNRRIAEWVEVEKHMEAVFQADRDEEAAVAQRLERPAKDKDSILCRLRNGVGTLAPLLFCLTCIAVIWYLFSGIVYLGMDYLASLL